MDKSIVKAAIDHVRKEMRGRLGKRIAASPATPTIGITIAHSPEGSAAEEHAESPAVESAEGDATPGDASSSLHDSIEKMLKKR